MAKNVLVLLLAFATSAAAFQPRTGHWNNPNEPGTGMNIDIQDGTFVVTIYSYATGGAAQWYIASGKGTNDNHNFTGSLDKFRGGQCISCTSTIFPASDGSDGAISITFSSEVLATVTLPGGRVTQIQPFNFGFGDPPNGLLGEWVFVYDIISTFADRFDFTVTAPGTAGGNGLVVDPIRIAGCELQVVGTLAGTVICADTDSQGNLQNGYAFKFGLDETFSGNWVSPFSGNLYAMKGFKVKSKNGSARAAMAADDPYASAKVSELTLKTRSGVVASDPMLEQSLQTSLKGLASAIWNASRAR